MDNISIEKILIAKNVRYSKIAVTLKRGRENTEVFLKVIILGMDEES